MAKVSGAGCGSQQTGLYVVFELTQKSKGACTVMTKLKIAMLGPSSVGKTSLLTVMHEQLEQTIDLTDLKLTPDQESKALLDESLELLKKLTASFKVTPEASLQGTQEYRNFNFAFGYKGKDPSVELEFWDYPGGYLSERASPTQKEFVKNLLNESGAVVIAIDTPALMVGGGRFNVQINKPADITALFKDVYENLTEPRLVVFAPVKCETYVQNEKDQKKLRDSIKREYATLLNFFVSSFASQVAVVITPVQTVGCVTCGGYETFSDGRLKEFYFNKTDPDAEFSPKDSDQPLRYLLRFLLKLHVEKRRGQFWGSLLDWFGQNEKLKEAVRRFAKGSKTTGGFEVLQGHALLNI